MKKRFSQLPPVRGNRWALTEFHSHIQQFHLLRDLVLLASTLCLLGCGGIFLSLQLLHLAVFSFCCGVFWCACALILRLLPCKCGQVARPLSPTFVGAGAIDILLIGSFELLVIIPLGGLGLLLYCGFLSKGFLIGMAGSYILSLGLLIFATFKHVKVREFFKHKALLGFSDFSFVDMEGMGEAELNRLLTAALNFKETGKAELISKFLLEHLERKSIGCSD